MVKATEIIFATFLKINWGFYMRVKAEYTLRDIVRVQHAVDVSRNGQHTLIVWYGGDIHQTHEQNLLAAIVQAARDFNITQDREVLDIDDSDLTIEGVPTIRIGAPNGADDFLAFMDDANFKHAIHNYLIATQPPAPDHLDAMGRGFFGQEMLSKNAEMREACIATVASSCRQNMRVTPK